MAHTLTEEFILNMLKSFGTLQEAQLSKMLNMHPTGVRRNVNKMWKKDLLKYGGPDGAYVMHLRSPDVVDMLYVDCIWVMLAHTDKEEDFLSAYKGKDVIKLTYFSREKQSTYNFVYVSDEEDYKKLPYINSRYVDMTDVDMIENMKFIFVSDSEDVLSGLPLNGFKFPSICIHIEFTYGRYQCPEIKQIEPRGRSV